ncbi:MAG: molecular chaperone DnaK [Phycisphaerales bacterium]
MGASIGIDLGTTNSVVTAYIDGKVVPIRTATGTLTVPSIVSFHEHDVPLVGHAGKNQQITSPERTIYSVKRFMGRRHSEVRSEEKIVPYEVTGKADELVNIKVGKRSYAPQEISAIILEELKQMAEHELGTEVTDAVITVPAYFNDAQRQATKEAAEIAGLNARRIINEPTAAALAYGFEKVTSEKRAIVVDFGGGTLDLSAMEIEGGRFKVLGVHGNTHLGGDDFDQKIIDVVADDFFRSERVDLREDPMALQRLKDAAQQAKVELSSAEQTDIMLPYVAVTGRGPIHLQYTLTREVFEGVCSDLLQNLRKCCEELRHTASVGVGPNMEIILVGGSTRIPAVRRMVSEAFDTDRLNKSVNPDEVVGVGAGILAAVLAGQTRNVNLMDVTSQTLGVESAGGGNSIIVPKNTPIPTTVQRVYTTPKDNQTSVPINVLEGDGKTARANRTLGLFRLKNIRKAKRGEPQIEVSFSIDADGILSVSATDLDTKKTQKIVIQGGSGLGDKDKDRLVAEGAERRDASQVRRRVTDLKAHAESVVAHLESWMEHNAEYLSESRTKHLTDLTKRIHKAIEAGQEAKLKKLLLELDGEMSDRKAA